jgi:hypothetical protein
VSLHSSPNATVTTQDRMFDFLKVAAGFTANTVTDQFGVTFLGLRAAPAALTSGPASIALIADSTDQQVEAIESNNSVLAANSPLDFQAVTGGPDVCPAGFISTSNALSVSINQPFTLSLDVTNVGDASGAGPSVVILEDGAGREVVVGSDAQTTYAAGGLITLTIQCTLPATIPTTAGPVATTAGDGFLTIALGLSPTTFQPQISGEVSTDNNFQLERITVN